MVAYFYLVDGVPLERDRRLARWTVDVPGSMVGEGDDCGETATCGFGGSAGIESTDKHGIDGYEGDQCPQDRPCRRWRVWRVWFGYRADAVLRGVVHGSTPEHEPLPPACGFLFNKFLVRRGFAGRAPLAVDEFLGLLCDV